MGARDLEVEMEGTGFNLQDVRDHQTPRETTVVVQADSGSGGKVEVKISEIAAKAVEVDNAALDSILSLNSFFCVAIFIGISLPAQQGAAQASADRAAGDNPTPPAPCALHDPESTRQTVLMLEIVAFACIMLSTLFAAGLKMVINMNANAKSAGGDARQFRRPGQDPDGRNGALMFFRFVMFLSAAALIAALVLLCVSMVFYVELYAGRITCSARSRKSTIPLILFTALGLFFLLLVLFLFIKFSARTMLQISNRIKKTLGLGGTQLNESLLPPAIP